jgi:carbon-monoxide dehydrogenase small subunit
LAQPVDISLSVNGVAQRRAVEPRLLLSDFIRQELGLTGTHVGCEHGVCGACTVLLDGEAVRSCLVFAVQADGAKVETVEGLTPGEGELHPLQQAFRDAHGLQCGFCTPGILMSMLPFLRDNPSPDEGQIREALSGNLCRCTGYENIVQAVALAAERMGGSGAGPVGPAAGAAGSGPADSGPTDSGPADAVGAEQVVSS